MILRAYQQRAVDSVREAAGKHRSVCLVAPTGAGKTTIGAAIAASAASKGKRVLWLAHRKELVQQAADTLRRFGLAPGTIMAQRPLSPHMAVQVASIQTLQSREERPPADIIIADECHHAPAAGIAEYLLRYPTAITIGLTATPSRGDGVGLGTIFRSLVVAATIRELTDAGSLVPLTIVRPPRELRSNQIAQHPAAAYTQHCAGRSALVFSSSVALAEQHATEFRTAGVRAETIHEGTSGADRSRWLAEFAAGRLPVLCNVAVLTEGTDLPIASAVILTRGCGTPGLLIQMAGRALRPHPSKTDAILVDLRGVTHQHGDPTEDRVYSLEGRGIRRPGEGDMQAYCGTCGAPKEPGDVCQECGFAAEAKPLQVTGDKLERYAHLKANSPDQNARMLATLLRKSKSEQQARVIYQRMHGRWPSNDVIAAAKALVAS